MKKKKIFEKSQNIEKELESVNLDKTKSPMIVKFDQQKHFIKSSRQMYHDILSIM